MIAIEQLRATLAELPAVRLAVLFGSAARGCETARSDVDLGVLLEQDDPGQLWPIDLAVTAALRRTVDLVDLHRAPPLLRLEIAREGLLIIERETGTWARFKAHAMLDWWDWAPLARNFHRLAARRLQLEFLA